MAKKQKKKEKLDPTPMIRRRLFRIWSEVVRKRAGFTCEVCSLQAGTINPANNKKVKLDAHHFLTRFIADNPLKWDPRNGVCACPSDHKFGVKSFHKNPIVSSEWVRVHRPESYDLILKHSDISVDLNNRQVLAEIEKRLDAGQDLDFEELKRIEKEFPREKKSATPQEKQEEKAPGVAEPPPPQT
jgi:hypothetical protein